MGKNKKNEEREKGAFLLGMLLGAACLGYNSIRPYIECTGEPYQGTIHITEGVGCHDGKGHKIVWR